MKLQKEVRRLNFVNKFCYTEDYALKLSDQLKNCVSCLCYSKNVPLALQELYTLVENLCTLQFEEDLKNDLNLQIDEFLYTKLNDLLLFEKESFLQNLKDLWRLFCEKSKLIRNVYIYLEANSTRLRKPKFSVWQMCHESFKKIILIDPKVRQGLIHAFELIAEERGGHNIDTNLLREIFSMLYKLELYEFSYEEEFLKRTQDYYSQQSVEKLQEDIVEYFYYVATRLNEEESRVNCYLRPETKSKIIELLFKILIEEKLDILIALLDEADIFEKCSLQDISAIYKHLQQLPRALEEFCKIFCKYMLKIGNSIIFDTKNEQNLIGNLLDFKDKINEILGVCFGNHSIYMEGVRVCFKKFINARKYKPAQFLAKFIDHKMRDKLIPEDLLDKIMVLFRYIQGKDVFEACYKRYLSKRLLLGKSSSQDAEKYMIGKLKLECGDGFTSKLEGIFRDIDLSENLVATFKQKHSGEPIEFSAYILTNSFWPTFTKFPVTLPDKMAHYQKLFQDFYKAKYSGRSLQWIGSLDTCLLKADLNKGKKELQVSLIQALILLLFNDDNILNYKNIKLQLNLNDAELVRTLMSLTSSKIAILVKSPPSGDIKECDEFQINEEFTNKLFRIKINQLQYKETEEEQKFTEEEVLHDRHLQIDAALVRLMKQNQTLKHNDLVARIYNILKFPLNPNDIKKRIEILIERDFLSRHPDDANTYLYVA